MANTKPTAFRFSPRDLAMLDAVQRHAGVRTRAETLRMILQRYVRAERIRVSTRRDHEAGR
jgi:hypothetical protein